MGEPRSGDVDLGVDCAVGSGIPTGHGEIRAGLSLGEDAPSASDVLVAATRLNRGSGSRTTVFSAVATSACFLP